VVSSGVGTIMAQIRKRGIYSGLSSTRQANSWLRSARFFALARRILCTAYGKLAFLSADNPYNDP